jgi:hypothetical protein
VVIKQKRMLLGRITETVQTGMQQPGGIQFFYRA